MTHTVCIPSSLVREAEDKREATRKVGYVARAATIFNADRVVVFPDRTGERRWGEGFVVTVLRYAATPPHLRQEAWDVRDELEYAGVLPPLRVASQTGSAPDGSESLTQGIVTEVGPEGRVRVTCGLQHPISLHAPDGMEPSEGERVTVRISSREPVRARLVDEPQPGYVVERTDLTEVLGRRDAGVRIATSRHGQPLTVPWLGDLTRDVEADGMTVAFGAPGRGLPDILGIDVDDVGAAAGTAAGAGGKDSPGPGGVEPVADPGFDLWLNTIPRQGSEVVRTEEALFASLACLTLTE
ncbi:RNA methyltransferase [Halobium salinum]|uniref:RNA methyltransferase n=1 Tax=Halobium salinum TaxID=1364940 RepID=A0ABD5PA09_9EURY|nr:RNA methyltransferase [Halobium salinum]